MTFKLLNRSIASINPFLCSRLGLKHFSSVKQTIPPKKEILFWRITGYIVENRQAFMNIGAMVCLIGYMITSQRRLDGLEQEFHYDRQKALEYQKVSAALNNEEWLTKVENDIRRSKPGATSKNLLKNIISNKVKDVLEAEDSMDENDLMSIVISGKDLNEQSIVSKVTTSEKAAADKKPKLI